MKIGILTFHKSTNNGAVIQAYSLSNKIKDAFPDCGVEIIDYSTQAIYDYYHFSFKKELKNLFKEFSVLNIKRIILKAYEYLYYKRKRNKVFEKCQNKLMLSDYSILDNSFHKLFKIISEKYDVLVVGSDAVWNYVTRGFPNAYFPDGTVTCAKMSYAASCYGMDFLKCPEQNRVKMGEIFSDFKFIGVRDGATEEMVKWSGCQLSPVHTCDPTVFLDVNNLPIDVEALKKKLKKRGFDFEKPTIGVMGSPEMCRMIRALYGKEYQIVALYNRLKDADVNLYDLEPFEWAYMFRCFKITFTTFFHGTLLSMRNGTPVICISHGMDFEKVHTPKTLDVLHRLGYSGWYFKTDYKGKNFDIIKQKADELMGKDMKEEILDRMNKEAESFKPFCDKLEELLR